MKNELKPFASYCVSNTITMIVYDVCDGGEYVMAALVTDGKNPTPRKHLIHCDEKSCRLYFNSHFTRYYLDEFMRI